VLDLRVHFIDDPDSGVLPDMCSLAIRYAYRQDTSGSAPRRGSARAGRVLCNRISNPKVQGIDGATRRMLSFFTNWELKAKRVVEGLPIANRLAPGSLVFSSSLPGCHHFG